MSGGPYLFRPNPPSYTTLKDLIGHSWGESKECVALVKLVCSAPATPGWKKGIQVQNNGLSIKEGTAIATFLGPNGTYQGHAAIYLKQDSNGIHVIDQWAARSGQHARPDQPAHYRTIRWTDGSDYYVIM